MKESIRVRRFREGDEAALFEIFHSAVHRIAVVDYTRRQIEAWAPRTLDALAWRDAMRTLAPFVALRGEQPVGYADLQGNGYIDHFLGFPSRVFFSRLSCCVLKSKVST